MEQGDIMKLKRWYLYLIVTLCFTIAFISINRSMIAFIGLMELIMIIAL